MKIRIAAYIIFIISCLSINSLQAKGADDFFSGKKAYSENVFYEKTSKGKVGSQSATKDSFFSKNGLPSKSKSPTFKAMDEDDPDAPGASGVGVGDGGFVGSAPIGGEIFPMLLGLAYCIYLLKEKKNR
ncbi:MAG: hypothetical protein LBD45_03085 [Bacteroidales bacterium]|jgi:hypothetical protein|nr:hypothetical protein [Bacteroidales bacterium]